MIERDLIQRLADAVESYANGKEKIGWYSALTEARAYLDQPPAEPVAWGVVNASGRFRKARGTKAAAERSLAEWLEDQSKKGYSNWRGHVVPLYAIPPDAAAEIARLNEGWRKANVEALELRAKIAKLETAQQWIKCSERIPPPETTVLALVSGHIWEAELRWETPGWEDTYEAYLYWDCPHDDGQILGHSEVTHWMPLPAPPKEES